MGMQLISPRSRGTKRERVAEHWRRSGSRFRTRTAECNPMRRTVEAYKERCFELLLSRLDEPMTRSAIAKQIKGGDARVAELALNELAQEKRIGVRVERRYAHYFVGREHTTLRERTEVRTNA